MGIKVHMMFVRIKHNSFWKVLRTLPKNNKCSINRNNSIIAISHYGFYSREIAKWCECSVIVAFKLIQFFSNFTI